MPKMATKQRLYTLQNCLYGSKIKNAYKHAKNVFTTHCSCSMQRTAPKNNIFFKIAKHGHQARAIDFAKSSIQVKYGKCIKTC